VRVTDAANTTASKGFSITIAPPALSVTTTSLSNGTVGVPYAGSVSASGGTPPYTWALESGSLPGGVTLDAAGNLSGTPNAAGTFTFSVRVTDAVNATASKSLSITVGTPALTVTTSSLANGTVGVAYAGSVSASGGTPPYTWALESGSLPGGVTLAAAGTLSGTPSAAGTFTFSVRVTDAVNAIASKGLSITIAAPALTITTTSLSNGTVGVAYSGSVSASGGTPPYTFSIDSGALPDGVSLSTAGSLSGTPTRAATFTFSIKATDAANASGSKGFTVTIAAPGLAITTNSLSNGTVGTAYSGSLSATGGTAPYTWSLESGTLPDGLSLSSAGVISGTPTRASSFTFSARVTDATNTSVSKSFSIGITAPALSITTATMPAGMVGTAYSGSVTATGGTPPYAWSLESGTVPDGLTLNAAGTLSGTPTRAGAFNFTVRVTDAATATASKALTVTINSPTLGVGTNSLPAGAVGAAYSASLNATGGTPPYTWSLESGTLPDGTSLSPAGSISGTPTRAATFSFTARVTDAQSATASKALSITISAPAFSVTTSMMPNGTQGVAYSASVSASGGTPP
jgi:hypothetical protein